MKRFLCLVAILAVVVSTSAFSVIRPVEQESAEDGSDESLEDLGLRQGSNPVNQPGNFPVGQNAPVSALPGQLGGIGHGSNPVNQPGNFPVGQNNFQQGSLNAPNAPVSALPGQLGGIPAGVPASAESVKSQEDLDLRQGSNPVNQPGNFPVGQNNFQQGSLNAPVSTLPGQLGGIPASAAVIKTPSAI